MALEGSLGDDHPLVANALMDVAKADTKQLMSLPYGVCCLCPLQYLMVSGGMMPCFAVGHDLRRCQQVRYVVGALC